MADFSIANEAPGKSAEGAWIKSTEGARAQAVTEIPILDFANLDIAKSSKGIMNVPGDFTDHTDVVLTYEDETTQTLSLSLKVYNATPTAMASLNPIAQCPTIGAGGVYSDFSKLEIQNAGGVFPFKLVTSFALNGGATAFETRVERICQTGSSHSYGPPAQLLTLRHASGGGIRAYWLNERSHVLASFDDDDGTDAMASDIKVYWDDSTTDTQTLVFPIDVETKSLDLGCLTFSFNFGYGRHSANGYKGIDTVKMTKFEYLDSGGVVLSSHDVVFSCANVGSDLYVTA